MALKQVTLSASTNLLVPLDSPTGRILVRMQSSVAETYCTVDGSTPVIPTAGVEVPFMQRALAGVAGDYVILHPVLYGDHMQIPTVQLISAGTPVVSVEW